MTNLETAIPRRQWPTITGSIPPFVDHPDRACAGKDTDLWFPTTGGGKTSLRAIAVCNTCPLRDMCRDWSLSQPAWLTGVWGGLTEEDRYRVRTGRALKQRTIPATFRPVTSGISWAPAKRVRAAVRLLHDEGHSAEVIARKVHCSLRTVQRHLRAIHREGAEQVAA